MTDQATIETIDPKEAALRVILSRLQMIDENGSSRGNFASGVMFDQMYQLNKPIFEHEINLIKSVLGFVEETKPQEIVAEETRGVNFDLG